MKIKQQYLKYLETLKGELADIKIDNHIDDLTYALEHTELVIPVIGGFSAGKSTLINSFLEREILSVGLTPETAIATELRYADDEYIEAVKTDASVVRYKIEELSSIDVQKYQYIKLYLNNKNLKSIEPFILVDMPGFDSPYDAHNEAIFTYLERGVHFVFLTTVEDGNITKSMQRELKNILEYEKDISFFLSKSNLRADSEVADVQEKMKEQVEDELDIKINVIPIGIDGKEALANIFKEINIDTLYEKIFLNNLKVDYREIEASLNTFVNTLSSTKDESDRAIEELDEALKKLTSKKERMLKDIKEKYSNVNVNAIVEEVGRTLISAKGNLVHLGTTQGENALSSEINALVKSTLIYEVKRKLSDISDNIVDDFSYELKDLEFSLSDNFAENISENIKGALETGTNALKTMLDVTKDGSSLFKVLGTVLAIVTNVIAPIIEVVLIFLPNLLSSFFENKAKAEFESKLFNEIIPSLKQEIRKQLPSILEGQISALLENIANGFELSLEQKQKEISEKAEERELHIEQIVEEIEKYKSVRDNVKELAYENLYVKRN